LRTTQSDILKFSTFGNVVDPWSSWLLSIFRGLGLRFESAEELSDIYPTPGGWWCSSLLLEEAMALVVP
jgi:hypothetical protein